MAPIRYRSRCGISSHCEIIIDRYVEARDVPISRNNWLLEAAVEKLDRHLLKRMGRDVT